jgi:hypothetical protein
MPGVGVNPPMVPATAFDQILAAGPGVVLTPTIGMLVPGYLMVVTTAHLTSMAALGQSGLVALETWLSARLVQLAPVFGPYLAFEHGSGASRHDAPSGACITHAHIHLIPTAASLVSLLQEALTWQKLTALEDLASFAGCNYALLGSSEGLLISRETDLPGQWIRRRIAEAIGRADYYDWGIFSGERELHETLSRIPKLTG